MSGEHTHPDLEERLTALEADEPPAPEPEPPRELIDREPITLEPGDDGAVIDGYRIKGSPGGHAIAARGLRERRLRDVTVRNCELDGFDFSVLSEYVDGLIVEPTVRVPLVAYCGVALFSTSGATISPAIDRVWRPGPYPTTGGRQNNAYAVKVDRYSTDDPLCEYVDVVDGVYLESTIWQCLNAHSGRHLRFARNEVHGSPRPVFVSTSSILEDVSIVDNLLLEPATTPGGTDDVIAIAYGSVIGLEIDGNTIGEGFARTIDSIDEWSGGPPSRDVRIGVNPGA